MAAARTLAVLALFCGMIACGNTGRVDAATLHRGPEGPMLRVTILADTGDVRLSAAHEAIGHWNSEFQRLDRGVRLDSGTVYADSIPDEVVRAAQREAVFGGGPSTTRLLGRLSGTPGDIVIIFTQTD